MPPTLWPGNRRSGRPAAHAGARHPRVGMRPWPPRPVHVRHHAASRGEDLERVARAWAVLHLAGHVVVHHGVCLVDGERYQRCLMGFVPRHGDQVVDGRKSASLIPRSAARRAQVPGSGLRQPHRCSADGAVHCNGNGVTGWRVRVHIDPQMVSSDRVAVGRFHPPQNEWPPLGRGAQFHARSLGCNNNSAGGWCPGAR